MYEHATQGIKNKCTIPCVEWNRTARFVANVTTVAAISNIIGRQWQDDGEWQFLNDSKRSRLGYFREELSKTTKTTVQIGGGWPDRHRNPAPPQYSLTHCKLLCHNSAVYSLPHSQQVSHLPILVRFFVSAVKQLHKLTNETYRIPNKRSLVRRLLFYYVIRHVKGYKSISSAIYWVLPVVNLSNNFHSHCTVPLQV